MSTYTTVQGDMWDIIAYKTMGTIYAVPDLMAANPQYHDCFSFPAGIVLSIPDTPPPAPPESLPPWKR